MGFKGRLGARESGLEAPVSLDAVAQPTHPKVKRRGLGSSAHRSNVDEEKKKKSKNEKDGVEAQHPLKRQRREVPRPERIRASDTGPHVADGSVRERRGLLVHHTVLLEGVGAVEQRVWADLWAEYFEFADRCSTPEQKQVAAAVHAAIATANLSHLNDEARFRRCLAVSAGLLPSLGFDPAIVADRSQGILDDVLDRFDDAYARAMGKEGGAVTCRDDVVNALVQLRQSGWKVCVLHPGSRARAQCDMSLVSRGDVVRDALVSGGCLLSPKRPYTDFVREAASRLSLVQSECVVLADHVFQVLDARASPCAAVASLVDPHTTQFFERSPEHDHAVPVLNVQTRHLADALLGGQWTERLGADLASLADASADGTWTVYGVFSEDGCAYECESVGSDGMVTYAHYGNSETISSPATNMFRLRKN